MSDAEVPLIAQVTTGPCPDPEQIEAVLNRWRAQPPGSEHRVLARDMQDMLAWLLEARRQVEDADAELAAVLDLCEAHKLIWATVPSAYGPPMMRVDLVEQAATCRSTPT